MIQRIFPSYEFFKNNMLFHCNQVETAQIPNQISYLKQIGILKTSCELASKIMKEMSYYHILNNV